MQNLNLRFCGVHLHAEPELSTKEAESCSFPPAPNLYVSKDKNGNPLSRYSDDYWNFKAYGFHGYKFDNNTESNLNLNIQKQLTYLHLYYAPLFPGSLNTVDGYLNIYKHLCSFADKHGVDITQLHRFPQLAKDLMEQIPTSLQGLLISRLGALIREEEILGFKIADSSFIEKLTQHQTPHIIAQNAYIPPRIWTSFIWSLEQIMTSYEQNKESISEAWTWLYNAYKINLERGYSEISPFEQPQHKDACREGRKPRIKYPEGALAFLTDRNLSETLARWIGYAPNTRKVESITPLSSYLNLVRDCSFIFILAHSIQRKSEGLALRSDCFSAEEDPLFGRIGLLTGETTKTDPDSDARWVVPLKVERAVKIMSEIAHLRLNNTFQDIDPELKQNPYLMTGSVEPWSGSRSGPNRLYWNGSRFIEENPFVFNQDTFRITKEDYKIAYQMTPLLKEKSWFKVGSTWHLNPHQLRRTLAANLFVSDVPEQSIQWLMKHKSIEQSYYYGRNHTKLRLNNSAHDIATVEGYRSTIRSLISISENSLGDSVHATKKNTMNASIINSINERDHKKLTSLIKDGSAAARQTLLGHCMTESCEYGGIESAIHCAGVDGKGPCKDAVFDKKKKHRLKALLESNRIELTNLPTETPRHQKLKHENEAIEVYLHATS